jgi:uncharacterized membrane protein YcaP (DUF421 family)
MEKEDIKITDIQRILLGDAPVEFLLEVLIRSLLTYIVLLIVMKLFGKRMSGKLTNTEMAVMLMFGAIVSSAMQIPDRGIVESCFVLFLILIFQRLFTLWTIKNRKLEKATLGTTSLIIKNGVIQEGFMKKELLSQNQLFRKLRAKSIKHLGEVKRLYMETNGSFTIFKNKEPIPGLSVLPQKDKDLLELQEVNPSLTACKACGTVYENLTLPPFCLSCGTGEWMSAVTNKEKK